MKWIKFNLFVRLKIFPNLFDLLWCLDFTEPKNPKTWSAYDCNVNSLVLYNSRPLLSYKNQKYSTTFYKMLESQRHWNRTKECAGETVAPRQHSGGWIGLSGDEVARYGGVLCNADVVGFPLVAMEVYEVVESESLEFVDRGRVGVGAGDGGGICGFGVHALLLLRVLWLYHLKFNRGNAVMMLI